MLNELSGNVTEWASNTVTVLDNLSLTNMPTEVSLSPAYPNPFNPSTKIPFTIKTSGIVLIKVFDLQGREIITLFDGIKQAGSHSISWKGKDQSGNLMPSGTYIYQINSNGFSKSKKMHLIK
jgi:flagellar hook assembly protein FlgD